MNPKKMAILISLSILFFTGCGDSSSSTTNTNIPVKEGNVVYDGGSFSLQVPKSWETIDKTSFTSNVPEETIIGFRNNIKSDLFTANVNIAQKELASADTTVKDFAKSSLEVLKNNLIGYQLLNEKDNKTSYFTEFEGKKSASEQIIHFRQLYMIQNSTAYTITGAYLTNEDESVITAIGNTLDSFILSN